MDWKEAKKEYREIPVPEELSERLEKTIREYRPKKSRSHIRHMRLIGTAAAVWLLFVTGMNTNTAFAAQMQELPVFGTIAKLFVFENYIREADSTVLNVTIPELKNTGYDDLESRINDEIRSRMREVLDEAERKAEAYREAFLQTGGDEADLHPMEIQVNYEIKCSNEHYLSFVVWKSESLASVYYEEYIYNIDLETGKELTLRDLLGPDYIRIASEAVKEQIEQRIAEDDNQIFFGYGKSDEIMSVAAFSQIAENQPFYINEEGQIVIVFEKYSIAPGYMGRPEFIVEP
jgi:hypothetical protein